MNKRTVVMVLVAVLIAGSGVLSACGSATTEEAAPPTSGPQEEPTAAPATDEPDVQEPTATEESGEQEPTVPPATADGMVLLDERCTECHDLQRVVSAQKDRAGWEETVDRMIRRGADLNTEERDVLVDYLAQTYGP